MKPFCTALCNAFGLPEPTPEYKFHPARRWRFDYAWEKQKVAVEIEGAIWTRGRHVRGSGYIKDCEKYNKAQEMGWVVLRYATGHIEYTQVAKVLSARGNHGNVSA